MLKPCRGIVDKIATDGECCAILFFLLWAHVAYKLDIGSSLPYWNVSISDGFHGLHAGRHSGSNSCYELSKLVCCAVLPGAMSGWSGD